MRGQVPEGMIFLPFTNELAYADQYLQGGVDPRKRLSPFMIRWIGRHRPQARRFMYFPNDWNLAATGEVWEIQDIRIRTLFKLTFGG